MIYSSEATEEFTESDIAELAARSASKNKLLGVTGFLLYKKNFFVQFLEGASEQIEALTERISKDPRHKILKQEVLDGSDEKVFPQWSMEYLSNTDLGGALSPKDKRFIVDCWSMLLPEELLKD